MLTKIPLHYKTLLAANIVGMGTSLSVMLQGIPAPPLTIATAVVLILVNLIFFIGSFLKDA